MNLQCMVGRHDWGPWTLRPALIGRRVEWLHWDRSCTRRDERRKWACRETERRWFQVRVPKTLQLARIGKAIPVEEYLRRIRAIAPSPETLPRSNMPPAEALRSLP